MKNNKSKKDMGKKLCTEFSNGIINTIKDSALNNITKSNINGVVSFLASLLTIILILSIFSTYFTPYIVSSTEKREYTPEDYLFNYNISKNPTYILKTTETASLKPKTLSFLSNDKSFQLPTDCFNIQVTPSKKYNSSTDVDKKKITFEFSNTRSEVENIQLSYSYKQEQRPNIVLLDYQFAIKNNSIEEILVIENTENAKVTSYKGAWLVYNNDSTIKMNSTSHQVFVQKEEVEAELSSIELNNMQIVIYSWDMDFSENEIKTVRIKTLTNLNHDGYDTIIDLYNSPGSVNPIFPYIPDTYDWVEIILDRENDSYANETDYANSISATNYIFPINKTIGNQTLKRFS